MLASWTRKTCARWGPTWSASAHRHRWRWARRCAATSPSRRCPGWGRRWATAGCRAIIGGMRDGEGILPGGLVHPDVEAAIAVASGSGNRIHAGVAADVGGAYGQSLSDVRVHHDEHAAALSRAVSARAFTVGNDIFFGAGRVPARLGRGAGAARPRVGPRRSAAGGAEHRAADRLAAGRHARARGRGRRPGPRLTGTGV